MRLQLVERRQHTQLVGGLAWCGRELISFSDDQQALKWTAEGDFMERVADFPFLRKAATAGQAQQQQADMPTVCVTDAQWLPSRGGDVVAIAATDGRFYLCAKTGRLEKTQEAHKGAVLCARWSLDGTALATGFPVYAIAWSPGSSHILITSGKNILIKPLQPNQKITSWKAHEGTVLKADWNVVNNLLVTCGEDRRYKVWDQYGRQLFSSAAMDMPIVSVAWNPTGEAFAVGGFNSLRMCDKLGRIWGEKWCYAHAQADCGSLGALSWSADGTQLAAAGGSGAVLFAHVVEQYTFYFFPWLALRKPRSPTCAVARRFEWKHLQVTVTDEKTVTVFDILSGTTETLEFREKIVKVSIDFAHLLVGTGSQLYIHNERMFNTPCIIDLPQHGMITALVQAKDAFLVVDSSKGLQVYSYDGKLISSPKYAGMKPEALNDNSVALSADTLLVRDSTDEKLIYVFDVLSGKLFGDEPLRHTLEITCVALDQSGTFMTRLVALIDKNHDLYVTPIVRPQFRKLANMVDSIRFHDDNPMLASIVDSKLVIWYYPSAVFIDPDVLPLTKHERSGTAWGSNTDIQAFFGLQCTLRNESGASVVAGNISPYPTVLLELVAKKKWEDAIRLCRTAKSQELWACLAVMSVSGNDLNTAEVAYAAIDEASKLQFICHVKELNNQEARNAELALFRHQFREAESILLTTGQVYRVVRMWVLLHNWERALDIASKFKNFVDVVLYHRKRYLDQIGFRESSKKFLAAASSVQVDEAKVKSVISQEEAKLTGHGGLVR
ncbi:hypothetical protein RI367_008152 [Sorochytrium milnesiophthora]